jgi:CTP synthase (UTP-ammonia lyase)
MFAHKCIYCNYITNKKYDFNRHLVSKRHLNKVWDNRKLDLKDFGNEDYSHISSNYLINLLKHPYGMIPIFLQKLHFSNKLNNNLEIRNKNDGLIFIYQNSKWTKHNRNEILDLIVSKYLNHLDIYWSMNKSTFSKFNTNNFNNFKNDMLKRNIRNLQKRQCEMVILNVQRNK